jgi:hypothetical protein
MATTTNYGWTTPDDTALVKDGASAIRTLGSSVDTTLKAQIDAQQSNWSLVNAGGTALTGASTITVSGISGANQIMINVSGASAGLLSVMTFRLNTDSGSNYNAYGLSLTAPNTYSTNNQTAVSTVAGTSIPFGAASNNGNSVVAGYLLVSGSNTAGLKIYSSASSGTPQTSNSQYANVVGGIYSGTSTISSVSIISSVGNFDAGTIYVYKSAN